MGIELSADVESAKGMQVHFHVVSDPQYDRLFEQYGFTEIGRYEKSFRTRQGYSDQLIFAFKKEV